MTSSRTEAKIFFLTWLLSSLRSRLPSPFPLTLTPLTPPLELCCSPWGEESALSVQSGAAGRYLLGLYRPEAGLTFSGTSKQTNETVKR